MMMQDDLAECLAACEARLGYSFQRTELLHKALTHSSSLPCQGGDNERLEFFGDSVLDMVIGEFLYEDCPRYNEGELTELKSAIVRRDSLARAAQQLSLRSAMVLGRGVANKDRLPPSIYANVFEALVAAIYLDGGYAAVQGFILRCLGEIIAEAKEATHCQNHKSNLQQFLQSRGRSVPTYRVIYEEGPDHDKLFEVAVFVEEREYGRGRGANKKEAEQKAARAAMQSLVPKPDEA